MIAVDPRLVIELVAIGRATYAAIADAVDDGQADPNDRSVRRLGSVLARLDRVAVEYLDAETMRTHDERQLPLF